MYTHRPCTGPYTAVYTARTRAVRIHGPCTGHVHGSVVHGPCTQPHGPFTDRVHGPNTAVHTARRCAVYTAVYMTVDTDGTAVYTVVDADGTRPYTRTVYTARVHDRVYGQRTRLCTVYRVHRRVLRYRVHGSVRAVYAVV